MGKPVSDAEILALIPAARTRARRATEGGFRAKRARYDRTRRAIVIELQNGAFFGFPAKLGEGLRDATAEELAEVEVTPSGEGLHWESLGVDLRVAAVLQGVFGTKAWMKELGRAGGSVSTAAKAEAARLNGRKGGRPRKAP